MTDTPTIGTNLWSMAGAVLSGGLVTQLAAHLLGRWGARRDAERAQTARAALNSAETRTALADITDRGTARLMEMLFRAHEDCEASHKDCEARCDRLEGDIQRLREALIRNGVEVPT